MKKYGNVLWLSLVWSLFYIAVNTLNKQLSPFVTGSSVRIMAFVLLTLVMAFGKRLPLLRCPKNYLPWLILIGCLGFLLDFTSFIGLRYSSAGTGTVLLKVDVIFVQVMAAFINREKFDKLDWLLTFVMLGGAMLVMGINPFAMQFRATDLFFVLSALFVSINAFIIQKVQRMEVQRIGSQDKSGINSVIAYYNNAVAGLLFITAALVVGEISQVGAVWSQTPLVYIVMLAGLGQVGIYTLYYRALAKHPVWIVKIILLLIPVFALAFETVTTRQLPGADKCIGTIIVLAMAVAVILKHSRPPKTA
ncbi:DMT family transporter [Oscillospiraceae bacterium MB08-C2-2]|nr:DMT family transporter [Oscillospiraceae bacterium MB08-C2-2]